jgi:hypothetical protein
MSEKIAVCRWSGWGEELLRRLTSLAGFVHTVAIADSVRRATSDENQITQKLDITQLGACTDDKPQRLSHSYPAED